MNVPAQQTLRAERVLLLPKCASCENAHEFMFYSGLGAPVVEPDESETDGNAFAYENVNPVEALLGDYGVTARYAGELARD